MNRDSKIRTMRIYREYFELIKSGVKTIEVRVAYSSMQNITAGTIIRFNDDPGCECKVNRVARYGSFIEMMQREDPSKINPNKSAEEQIADIRRIFPPHKERMGVIAFELERI